MKILDPPFLPVFIVSWQRRNVLNPNRFFFSNKNCVVAVGKYVEVAVLSWILSRFVRRTTYVRREV